MVVVTGGLTISVTLTGWVLSGLGGMGLANTASLSMAFAHAPEGEEGCLSSSALLSDLFFPATTIGFESALVAFGAARQGMGFGLVLAFGLSLPLAALLLASVYRLPGDPAGEAGS